MVKASETLRKRFGSDVTFNVTYIPDSKLRMTIAVGPLDLIDNPSTKADIGAIGRFTLGVPPLPGGRRSRKDEGSDTSTVKVKRTHPAFNELFTELISDITRDLLFLVACSTLYNLNYITDRTADLIALSGSNSKSNVELNRSLLGAFSHDMPIVFGAPLSSLLKLRQNEWEAFQVYRDALRQALQTVGDNRGADAQVVFNDVVLPELNRIDLLFKRNRKLLAKAAARDASFAAGAVAIGLLTGFVSPAVADAIAKLGGLKYGIDTARNIFAAFSEPKEVQDNRYFFLWKARRMLKEYSR